MGRPARHSVGERAMIGHLVIAVLVFAGVLAPFVLVAEWSHRRERRRREARTARGSRSALRHMPTPAARVGQVPHREAQGARGRAEAAEARGPVMNDDEIIVVGSLRIDLGSRRVFVGGEERVLTRKLFEMLVVLVSPPGRAISWDDLY